MKSQQKKVIYYTKKGRFEHSFDVIYRSFSYKNLHRTDGPAIIFPNGDEWWVVEGKFHRKDGPAIITDGEKQWWINGKPLHHTHDEISKWVTENNVDLSTEDGQVALKLVWG